MECADYSVSRGDICAVVTETGFDKSLLLQLLTGFVKPDSGKIYILGKDLSIISDNELNEVRQMMGVVFENGGLISNLKVGENIMLPVSYHSPESHLYSEQKMMKLLEQAGYDEEITILPGPLPLYKKRLAGLVRAMLTEPELIIYDSIFDGLSQNVREKVHNLVSSFHFEKEGRASLFLASDKTSLRDISPSKIHILKNGRFDERD
ncbi:MAG: ATP-binding cassette domain-containing protein [Nitrospiraceae bacterium]|nr:ATP-binding cassette domain-containing protein [Nitrospiraceae bacterium]